MSDIATTWAWRQLQYLGPTPAFVTLMLLANEADTDGLLKRTRADLASKINADVRTVTRHMKRLVESDMVEVYEGSKTDGGQGPNTYQLRMDKTVQPTKSVQASEQGKSEGGAKSVQPSVPSSTSRGKDSSEEQFSLTIQGVGKREPTPKVKIDGKALTNEEWVVARRALATFNECNGSRILLIGTGGGPTDALKRIVSRQREHPHLTADDHERIVRANFANPWWKEDKLHGVGPIYGPKPWPRAMANDGKRPTGKKKSYERNPEDRTDPGW